MAPQNLITGIYDGISSREYHSLKEYVSKSYLSRLDKCPLAAKTPQEDTPAMILGRAGHSYVLEPEVFHQEFVVTPNVDKRTKGGKEEWAQFQAANAGKDLITADDMVIIEGMRSAVLAHPFAAELLKHGVSEQTVIWEDLGTGIMCKCRPDRIPSGGKGVLVDLKTTADASERGFTNSIVKFGYDLQAAFYLDGVNMATRGNYDAFAFIAVEKTAPYRVETYLLDADFIARGRQEYQRLLRIEQECRAYNFYPHYQQDGLVTIRKPAYL